MSRISEDDQEFAAFVAASYRSLRRVAFLMVGDWHLAEDVVQMALVSVYRQWSRVDASYGAGPYARRAVVNAALSQLRRTRRREILLQDVPDRAVLTDEYPLGFDESVVRALQALTPRQRAVVILRYAEDFDVRRTADLLGLPEGTVRSLAARGLTHLRLELGRLSLNKAALSETPIDDPDDCHDTRTTAGLEKR